MFLINVLKLLIRYRMCPSMGWIWTLFCTLCLNLDGTQKPKKLNGQVVWVWVLIFKNPSINGMCTILKMGMGWGVAPQDPYLPHSHPYLWLLFILLLFHDASEAKNSMFPCLVQCAYYVLVVYRYLRFVWKKAEGDKSSCTRHQLWCWWSI